MSENLLQKMKKSIKLIGRKEAVFYVVALGLSILVAFLISKNSFENNKYIVADVPLIECGGTLQTDKITLPAGNYSVSVDYFCPVDSVLNIKLNDAYLAIVDAPAVPEGAVNSITNKIEVPWSSSEICVAFSEVNAESGLRVDRIAVEGNRPLNNDAKFKALVFLAVMILVILHFHYIIHRDTDLRKNIGVIALLGVTIYLSTPLFGNVVFDGHDLLGLCGRIEGIKDAWDCGQAYPIVMPNAFNGFGYLEYMYPELFLLIPAFLRKMNVSMVLSLHFYEFLINFATGIIAYWSIHSVLKTISSETDDKDRACIYAFVGALIYLFSAYRLTDLYTRAAIGETVSMTFLPLAFAGLFHILDGDRKKWWMAVIGMSGIYHSHILSCALIVPVVLIFLIFYCKNIFRDKRYIEIGLSVAAFFVVNLWNIIPFIKFFNFGLNTDALVIDKVEEHTVLLRHLFSMTGGMRDSTFFLRSLGISSAVILIVVIIYYVEATKDLSSSDFEKSLRAEQKRQFKLMNVVTVCFAAYTLLSLEIMPWKWFMSQGGVVSKAFSMLQFPFRLLTISSVCIAFMFPLAILGSGILRKNYKVISLVVIACGIIGAGLLIDNYMSDAIGLETITGGYSLHVPQDYLPAGTDLSVISDLGTHIENGTAEFTRVKDVMNLSYESDVPTVATVPLFYYPCYKAYDENGNRIELFMGEDKRLNLNLPAGKHIVTFKISLY